MSTKINLPGPNQKQKNTARANEGETLGLAASARIKRKGKSSKFFINGSMNGLAVFQHSSAMALMAMAVVSLFAVRAQAIDVEVRDVVLQEASTAELDETVILRGTLIFNTANPLDFRLGDGTRLGGWQLYNFAALTSPPSVYNTNILLNGHSLYMGAKYSLVEEGNGFFIRDGTNTVVRIFSEEGGAFDSFSSYVATPTQIVVTVNCRVGDPAPVLEWTASITEPDWQEIAYELVRVSEDSVRLTIDTAEIDSAYVRITVVPPVSAAAFAIPVAAPSYLIGTNPITAALVSAWNEAASFGDHAAAGYLTAETDPAWTAASGGVVYAASAGYTAAVEQAATAYGWGNHADAGYLTGETDPSWTAASGSVVYAADVGYTAAVEQAATAYGWGDHAGEGYLTAEIDPSWTAASGSVVYAADVGYTAAVEQAATAYGWGDHAGAGYLTAETDSAALEALENCLVLTNNVDAYELNLRGAPASWTRLLVGSGDSIMFGDDEVFYNGFDLWDASDGTNIWRGRIGETESARIRTDPSPMSASGTVTIAANTTNYFRRPDGGTNTVSFDVDGNMIVAVDGTTALSIRTNGNIGVKNTGSATYSVYASGDIYATSRMRALEFRASDAAAYYLDPNGESILAGAKYDADVHVAVRKIHFGTQTNCWLVTDGTNLFFRNVAGTTNALTSN